MKPKTAKNCGSNIFLCGNGAEMEAKNVKKCGNDAEVNPPYPLGITSAMPFLWELARRGVIQWH